MQNRKICIEIFVHIEYNTDKFVKFVTNRGPGMRFFRREGARV